MKLKIATLSVLSLFVFSSAAFAFGGIGKTIGSEGGKAGKIAGKAADTAGSMALIDSLNKDLEKQGCQFKDSTTDSETTCSMSEVASIISKHRSAIENIFGKKVRIDVTASANEKSLANTRGRNIRDQLSSSVSWWRINWNGVKDGTNNLKIVANKY